jgi:C1A family cysteine protease
MANLTLADLRAALRRADLRWEAGETEIAALVKGAQLSQFGLSMTEPERVTLFKNAQASEATVFMAAPPPPPRIDWRAKGGSNWVTAVRNQRTCGSCVSFATCAVLEARTRIDQNKPTLDIDLSESHLFFCGCGNCCQTGWNFVPALDRCKTSGVGKESDFPYQPTDQPCKNVAPVVKVASYAAETTDIKRKMAIASNGPVIAGMRVFEDFLYYKGGIYKHVAGDFRGLHAIAVVGYDDDARAWIIKNSWSGNWGEGGFARIGYGEVGLDSEFAFYDPAISFLGGGGQVV